MIVKIKIAVLLLLLSLWAYKNVSSPFNLPKFFFSNTEMCFLEEDNINFFYFLGRRCWQPNTKCPAERTRPSLSKTHNPELKSNVSLLYNLPKIKIGTNSKSMKMNGVGKQKLFEVFQIKFAVITASNC